MLQLHLWHIFCNVVFKISSKVYIISWPAPSSQWKILVKACPRPFDITVNHTTE